MNVVGCDHKIKDRETEPFLLPRSTGFERFERSAAVERLERLELAAALKTVNNDRAISYNLSSSALLLNHRTRGGLL
jgi:hypothetical protein